MNSIQPWFAKFILLVLLILAFQSTLGCGPKTAPPVPLTEEERQRAIETMKKASQEPAK